MQVGKTCSTPPTTGPTTGIRMPTNDEIKQTYNSIFESARKAGSIEQLDAPPVSDPSKYPSYDVTPEGLQDLTRQIFNIKGDLYVQQSSLFGPGGRPSASWGKIGPAPMF